MRDIDCSSCSLPKARLNVPARGANRHGRLKLLKIQAKMIGLKYLRENTLHWLTVIPICSEVRVKLCWAVTAHKSQGQSLARVAIDIAEPAFAHGSLYVALSRVRSLGAVRLFGCSEFPENGPFFHINRYIMAQEPDQGLNDF